MAATGNTGQPVSTRAGRKDGAMGKIDGIPLLMRRIGPLRDAVEMFTELQCRTLGSLLRTMEISDYLVVDDSSVDAKVLEGRFAARGKHLRVYREELPSWVREGCPLRFDPDNALALVDLHIPGTDGREVAAALRAQSHGIVVVALTATRPRDTGDLFTLFDGVLLKPLSEDCLSMLLSSSLKKAKDADTLRRASKLS